MLYALTGFLVGIVLGSFTKVLADRSLLKKSFQGRSYCPRCKHRLSWYDLIPVFSFLLLRGKCRYCHKKIGNEYLMVEVLMGFLIAFLFWQSFRNFQSVLDLSAKVFFITILTALFLTDLKKMLIPDRIILPALVIVFILHPFLYNIAAGLAIGLFFYSLIVITRGKGMGGGDVKLGVFIGLMLGFPAAPVAIVLSFLSGAVFSIWLIISGKKHFGQTIPFGPFLVLGSLSALFFGERILDWYLHLGI